MPALRSAALLCLLLPALSSAQSRVQGSPLTAVPNVSIGCEVKPALLSSDGNYSAIPSGVADCTWWQSGVFGVLTDPRFASVPGDGRITSVRIRSGPNPSPIRIVILRHFVSVDECCFFVSETGPLQPQPNTITTFQTNILVKRNIEDGILAVDLVGLSALSGAGTLPLSSTGRNNAFQFTEPGSVNAAFLYPRMGALPNDPGGGRREEGMPGIEVLMQWTWCPLAAAAANGPGVCGTGGPGPGGPGPATGVALRSASAVVARGRALLDLVCQGSDECRGRLALVALGGLTAGRARASGPVRYGKRKYALAPGAGAILGVELNRRAKRLLKQGGSLQVGVELTPAGGTPTTATVTLTR